MTHEQTGTEEVQDKILRHLNQHGTIENTVTSISADSQLVLGVLNSLASRAVS